MTPLSGRSNPATQRSVVVLPQPLGPRNVYSEPSGMLNETPLRTWTLSAPSPKYFSRLLISTMTLSSFTVTSVLPAMENRLARALARHWDEPPIAHTTPDFNLQAVPGRVAFRAVFS